MGAVVNNKKRAGRPKKIQEVQKESLDSGLFDSNIEQISGDNLDLSGAEPTYKPLPEDSVNKKYEATLDKLEKAELNKREKEVTNCLKKVKVIVRHLPKKSMVTDSNHVLFGNMAETAERVYVVPMLTSGLYVINL